MPEGLHEQPYECFSSSGKKICQAVKLLDYSFPACICRPRSFYIAHLHTNELVCAIRGCRLTRNENTLSDGVRSRSFAIVSYELSACSNSAVNSSLNAVFVEIFAVEKYSRIIFVTKQANLRIRGFSGKTYKKIIKKNITNVKRCRDGMPKSMQTR